MVVPPTPKPTCKAEALAKAPPTIASSCEENAALKKWHLPLLQRSVFSLLETAKKYVSRLVVY
jgi:hypothetical protein